MGWHTQHRQSRYLMEGRERTPMATIESEKRSERRRNQKWGNDLTAILKSKRSVGRSPLAIGTNNVTRSPVARACY